MFERIFITLFVCLSICEAIYLNPYSVGSYDPAAENPYYYQYYSRYYNPNPHNPYAPYPTYLKKGYFTLPRMYQIDPSWARYYPGSAGRNVAPNYPDYFNYPNYPGKNQNLISRKTKKTSNPESIAVFPDECESSIEENTEYEKSTQINPPPGISGSTVARSPWNTVLRSPGYTVARASGAPLTQTQMLLEDLEENDRPKWSDTVPSDDVLMNFARPATLVRPRVPRNPGASQTGQQYVIQENTDAPSSGSARDFERLPIDRISYNQNKGSHDGSAYVTGPR